MNIVYCADRSALPGLHVAAYSVLERISPTVVQTHLFVFSDELDDWFRRLTRCFQNNHGDVGLFFEFKVLVEVFGF